MRYAGPSRLFVVEFCRWLSFVTWFVHVVARHRRRRQRRLGTLGGVSQVRRLYDRGARGAVFKSYYKVRVSCPSGPPWYWRSCCCSALGSCLPFAYGVLNDVVLVPVSIYAVAYSWREGFTMTLERKMPFRSQRQCQSQTRQNHGTPFSRNYCFRFASRSAVRCLLCCCAKGSTFSTQSECSRDPVIRVRVLTNAIPLPSVRLYTWRASLFPLLLTIIVLVPASFCMVLTYRSGSSPSCAHSTL